VIVCLRTVTVPPEWRERYLAWIADGRAIRQQHGILAELVCEPATPDEVTGGYLNLPGLTTYDPPPQHAPEEPS